MPDPALFDAAADGSILTEEGYRAQVDRVFDDPRTRDAIAEFYREWLDHDVVGGFPDTPLFRAFAAGADVEVAAMREEIEALTAHYTWDEAGTLRDLLLTDLSLTRSPELARLYGVEPWDGASAPPRFPPGERPGLYTRAAFLINGEHETNPIHRSAMILRRVLCRTIAPPDPTELPEGALDPPVFSPDMTTRQRWEEKTRNPPCSGCHATINPPGFVLERFDALGRIRATETILDERTGEPVATHPIDTRATVSFATGVEREIGEPVELMELVTESEEVEACFARQYFRFTYARPETAADGCALAGVSAALGGATDGTPGSLRQALRAIALDPGFRRRAVEEE
jgi:hypothetical protein